MGWSIGAQINTELFRNTLLRQAKMRKQILGIIPVRLNSTRLPGKALADICGLPAVVHTYMRSALSRYLDYLTVATDSHEIAEVCKKFSIPCFMTPEFSSGSERVHFTATSKQFLMFDYIINIQGDEVMVKPGHIDAVIESLQLSEEITFGIHQTKDDLDSSDIKAVLNTDGKIIYMSRADIKSRTGMRLKVVFIVGYNRTLINRFAIMPETPLDKVENNEFMRLIYYNQPLSVAYLTDVHRSLDTVEDLDRIRNAMRTSELYRKYEHLKNR